MNRSDFFIGMVNVGFRYVVASSCRLKGKAKTSAGKAEEVWPRRSGSYEEAQRPPAESEVLHGNQQRCRKRSILSHVSRLFAFRLDWCSYVSSSFE